MTTSATLTALTLTAAGLAAAWDVRTRKIPNWLTFTAFLLGVTLNAFGAGLSGLGIAVFGMLAGVALLLVPFAMGGMGAGDVKILGAVGAMNGATFAFRAFLYGSIAGGFLAVAVIIMNWTCGLVLKKDCARPAGLRRMGPRNTFPYGVAIFAGTVAAYILR